MQAFLGTPGDFLSLKQAGAHQRSCVPSCGQQCLKVHHLHGLTTQADLLAARRAYIRTSRRPVDTLFITAVGTAGENERRPITSIKSTWVENTLTDPSFWAELIKQFRGPTRPQHVRMASAQLPKFSLNPQSTPQATKIF